MKICLFGKFPPIQGGVSSLTYITAHRLAENGNQVYVITNANEVESCYKQYLDVEDFQKLEKQYFNGSVKVYNTSELAKYSFIPFSNPYSSKLLGLGFKVINDLKPDLLIGWYFEPYGVVASLLAKQFNIPCIIRHAGSDIRRLSQNIDLGEAYKLMLLNANYLVTSFNSKSLNRIKELGITSEKLLFVKGFRLPPYFSDNASKLDINIWKNKAKLWFDTLQIDSALKIKLKDINSKTFDNTKTTIGIYGKVGQTKGSYDLIKVISDLAKENLEFNFVIIAAGNYPALERFYSELIQNKYLADRLFILPIIANWKIPSFIRSLDICCFLERDFSIEFHSPKIPFEILSSGQCLVISKEIMIKNAYSDGFLDNENCIIVNPKEHEDFRNKLRNLINNPFLYKKIGRNGKLFFDLITESNNKNSVLFEDIIEELKKLDSISESKFFYLQKPN